MRRFFTSKIRLFAAARGFCVAAPGLALAFALFGGPAPAQQAAPARISHAIAMHGEPALGPGFDHLPYANPAAPKGGVLHLGAFGAFDNHNPYGVNAGSTALGLTGPVYESLMARNFDEPFTLYGLIARTIETNDERSFVTFRLNPAAHFSDGAPITAKDVLFTFNLLKARGRPQQRAAYALVKSIDAPDDHTV
ncbi:MAG: ABC transporter substrate-binding protein, partial [Rhodoblastus sp.]|uniref:ABC transporter substrate-binding protein n=1 Tax=Rhodoblastus sp. TaxID=1962975 RepID=UPI003F97D4FF